MSNPLNIFKTNNIQKPELTDILEASWKSPSNIALVKYWGKKPGQLPANPSLSMTLSKAVTYTWVKGRRVEGSRGRGVEGSRGRGVEGSKGGRMTGVISINEDPNHPFISKLQKLYDILAEEIPVLKEIIVEVKTENTFPHSTGIASSASGISAFTFCLLDIIATLTGSQRDTEEFYRAVSYASRMGSGSACRSVYGGFTIWGKTEAVSNTSDYEAVPINEIIHPDFLQLQDSILVVSSEPKSMASSLGHSLMNDHPFASGRYLQANENLEMMINGLHTGDFELVANISENEALSLHALMMTSGENGFLMKPGTVEIIQKIRKARKEGLPVFFTLDAGPNIHMLFPKSFSTQIEQFTQNELLLYCENNHVIFDEYGAGAVPIHTSLL